MKKQKKLDDLWEKYLDQKADLKADYVIELESLKANYVRTLENIKCYNDEKKEMSSQITKKELKLKILDLQDCISELELDLENSRENCIANLNREDYLSEKIICLEQTIRELKSGIK